MFSLPRPLSRLLAAVEVPREHSSVAEDPRWSNIDLEPSPPKDRKWTKWVYLAFWCSHAASANNWTSGSSTISLGLSPIVAWVAVATAHLLATILIVLNGRGPARYHIGFPIIARSVYGMWGSYLVVGMRALVCIIWNGVNCYYGARLVTVAIAAIWPNYLTLPNTLPDSAGISSVNLGSFFIFMFVFTSMSFIHSRDLKYFYYAKSILVFGAMHGVLIWWMIQSHGLSDIRFPEVQLAAQPSQAWLVLQAFNAGLGTASSLTVNQGDIARYAQKPSDQLWTTLIGYPIASALPCLYGILVASASSKLTGTPYWNLWDTLEYMLQLYPNNSGARFAIFLAASCFALAYLGVNLATNCLPFGSDMTAMFPRYFTIRRGQVLCALLSVAIVPWKILVSAQAFLTFLGGYGYWLAPIAAVLMVDYYFVRRGNLDIPQLYTGSHTGQYWFYHGWNVRAAVTTILALIPCLPGFAAAISPKPLGVGETAQNIFYISFVLTYAIAGVAYWGVCYVFPPPHHVPGQRFEQEAKRNEQWGRGTAATPTSSASTDRVQEIEEEKRSVKTASEDGKASTYGSMPEV